MMRFACWMMRAGQAQLAAQHAACMEDMAKRSKQELQYQEQTHMVSHARRQHGSTACGAVRSDMCASYVRHHSPVCTCAIHGARMAALQACIDEAHRAASEPPDMHLGRWRFTQALAVGLSAAAHNARRLLCWGSSTTAATACSPSWRALQGPRSTTPASPGLGRQTNPEVGWGPGSPCLLSHIPTWVTQLVGTECELQAR